MKNYLRINVDNKRLAFEIDVDKSISENLKEKYITGNHSELDIDMGLLMGLLNQGDLNLKHNLHGDIDLESKLSDFSNLIKQREDEGVNYGLIDLELNYNSEDKVLKKGYLRINDNDKNMVFKVDLNKSLSENLKEVYESGDHSLKYEDMGFLIGLLNQGDLNLKHNLHGDIDLESKLSDFSNLVKEREDIINDREVNYSLIDLELNYNGDKDIFNAEIIANNSNSIKSLFSKEDESKIKNLYENIVKSYSNLVHGEAKEDFNLKLDGNKIEISKKIDAHIIENNGNFYAFDSTDIVMNINYNNGKVSVDGKLKVSTEDYGHPFVYFDGCIDSNYKTKPEGLEFNKLLHQGSENLIANYLRNVTNFIYEESTENRNAPVHYIENVGNKIATNFKDAVKYAKKNNIKTERIYRAN